MCRRSFHSTRRFAAVAALLVLLGSAGGCTLWDDGRWGLDRFRDDRAVDIDHRLEGTKPIVVNPF